MSHKLLFSLNSLFERKKPQKERSIDELAIVKAAAWAWYQHGSGSEGKAISEFDVTRTQQRVSRPSRYKLEAMRISKEAKEESQVHNKGSLSLLDTYEVQSISKIIDSGQNRVANSKNSNGERRVKKKKKKSKGFWSRHGVVCGGGNDVVDGTALKSGGLAAKGVPVVNLAKCLPRTNSAL